MKSFVHIRYLLHHFYNSKWLSFRFQAGEPEDCWIKAEHSISSVVLLSVFSQVRKPKAVKYYVIIIFYKWYFYYSINDLLSQTRDFLMQLNFLFHVFKEGCLLVLQKIRVSYAKFDLQAGNDCFLEVNNLI